MRLSRWMGGLASGLADGQEVLWAGEPASGLVSGKVSLWACGLVGG